MITNKTEFLAHLSADSEEQAKRHTYKYTDCGAWLEFTETGVRIGSIVEGCDFGTATYPLNYPFTEADYDARMQAVEAEASALWDWANKRDCEGDAPDVDWEYRHLGPDGRSS